MIFPCPGYGYAWDMIRVFSSLTELDFHDLAMVAEVHD